MRKMMVVTCLRNTFFACLGSLAMDVWMSRLAVNWISIGIVLLVMPLIHLVAYFLLKKFVQTNTTEVE